MDTTKRVIVAAVAAAVATTSLYAARPGSYGEVKFQSTLTLFQQIAVEKVKNLEFGDVLINGRAHDVVVNSTADEVAKFRANGDRLARISAKVVEDAIIMKTKTAGPNHEIRVDAWQYGGNVDANGLGRFDSDGAIQNIRVGGIAHIKAQTKYGNYAGSATLRVTYL